MAYAGTYGASGGGRYEKGLIVRALEQSRTVTEAAEKLRLTRQALQYKMMKYHLNG